VSESKKQLHLPIGYWIRRADQLLTASIDKAQKANGLSRTDWQILNALYELGSAVTIDELATPMRPFLDAPSLHEAVTSLDERGLVTEDRSVMDKYVLTASGR
jgi:hypothetical protein